MNIDLSVGAVNWVQGSDDWHQQRLGKVTASRVADVIARTKTGWGAMRANYAAELVLERLTGVRAEGYISAAMQHGTDTEPQARSEYEFMHNVTVEQVGFVPHPTIRMSGASPDGLIGTDGLIEIKCPNSATMIETLLDNNMPQKYITQIMWQLACTGRQWCDFVMFDPRLPAKMQLFIKRIHRDDKIIADLEQQVVTFLEELDEKVAALRARYETEAAA